MRGKRSRGGDERKEEQRMRWRGKRSRGGDQRKEE